MHPLPQRLHQQVQLNNCNMLAYAQQPMLHSNTTQQQALFSVGQPTADLTDLPNSIVTNPTVASTPISSSTKRGRNDASGLSDSTVQERHQEAQINCISIPNNASSKRLRSMNNPTYQTADNLQQPSTEACRFATTRYPFSLFSVTFAQEVRDTTVVDDLTKYINENHNFDLKLIAYRRGRSENNECRILIFVENSSSFAFLYNQKNWPTTLAGYNYLTKKPSIPPQLSLVLPSVSMQTNWEDFVQELKDLHPDIANIVRLKNKAQQPIRAVKLDVLSASARNEILETGEISIMHIKYKVVGFFAQANVLICSNCYGIGHFRKNCSQKSEAACKTCGEKCSNLKDHRCSGILKCVHCGGPHVSNDAKCNVIQQYRTVLTRNLLSKVSPINTENVIPNQHLNNLPYTGLTTTSGLSYANVVKGTTPNSNGLLIKKMDSIPTKVEEESNSIRHSINELKQEIRNRYEEVKQQAAVLEEKIKVMEKKFLDFSIRTGEIIQNICTTLMEPQNSQGQQWKAYWQEQIKAMADSRPSITKSSK
ncbi:unnamed protein product [Rotaria sp. Silwood1]|nr:unnamed protein product [Rotaria sp. Silwood1]